MTAAKDGKASCGLAPSVVGHAFHALEPDEEHEVSEHVAHCAECRTILRDALGVGAALGGAVVQIDPPAALRDRIVGASRAEPFPPREAPVSTDDTVDTVDGVEAPLPFPTGGDRTPAGRGPGRRSRWAIVAAGVAAAALGIGLLGVRAVVPTQAGPDAPVATQADRAQRIVDSAAGQPGTRHATLRAGGGDPVAVVLDNANGVRVVPVALPAVGDGRRYVLWSTSRGAAAPVAVVDPGLGTTDPLPGRSAPPGARGYAVSVEPVGAVPTRPTNVVAIGALV